MFPSFEKIIGKDGFLEGNVDQHHAFQPALKKLLAYGSDTKTEQYDAVMLLAIVEELGPALRQHLSDEIPSLLSMQPYDGPALLEVYKECEAEAGKQDKVSPVFTHLHSIPAITNEVSHIARGASNGTWPAGCRFPERQQLAGAATTI